MYSLYNVIQRILIGEITMKNNLSALLLGAALLLASLASCGGDTTQTAETTAAPETADVSTETVNVCDPGLPAMDFGGENFVFAMRGADGDYNDITADATDGDALNDAVYYRNE